MMFTQISFHWFAISKQRHRPKMFFHQQLSWGTSHVPHDRGDQKHFGFQPTRFLTAGEALAFSVLRNPFHQVSKKKNINLRQSDRCSPMWIISVFLGASCFFYCKLIENRIIPVLVVGFCTLKFDLRRIRKYHRIHMFNKFCLWHALTDINNKYQQIA